MKHKKFSGFKMPSFAAPKMGAPKMNQMGLGGVSKPHKIAKMPSFDLTAHNKHKK